MDSQKKINVLIKIAHALNTANVTWALGGSMLLYLQNVTTEFHDIDLMVKCEQADTAKAILVKMGSLIPSKPKARFQTKTFLEFVIDGVDVDVMAGFVIVSNGIAHDCSLRKEDIAGYITLGNEKIPLQPVALWRRYYDLMGNTAKVQLIDATTNRNPAEKTNTLADDRIAGNYNSGPPSIR